MQFSAAKVFFFVIYIGDPQLGIIAVGGLCGANGDFGYAEMVYGSPTYLREHLDTKWKGHAERR